MANFIFLKNDSYNSPVVAKLAVIEIEGDYDWWHIKTRPIKATKRNIELLKLYAREKQLIICVVIMIAQVALKERIR